MEATSPEVFVFLMGRISVKYKADPEEMHKEADKLMMRLLESLGYQEGVAIFDRMEKWYA